MSLKILFYLQDFQNIDEQNLEYKEEFLLSKR